MLPNTNALHFYDIIFRHIGQCCQPVWWYLEWPQNRVFRIWPNTLIARISISRISIGRILIDQMGGGGRKNLRLLRSTRPAHSDQTPATRSDTHSTLFEFGMLFLYLFNHFMYFSAKFGHLRYLAIQTFCHFSYSANWNSTITIITVKSLEIKNRPH